MIMAELTTNYYINQANSFIADIKDTRNAYYVFAGKPTPWPNDSSPPAADDSVEQTGLSVYRDLLFGKLIANSDIQALIPRLDWTSNTVYTAYDQNELNLFDKNFVVVNDQFQVYKCLFNNSGRPSTVQPRLASAVGTFTTSDGYVWKYMYTVDASANTKFTTSSYIPVATNANVSGNAVSGSIDAFKVLNQGSGYSAVETGFISRLVDNRTIQLPSTSSANDNFYAKSSIYLKSGFGAGQIREIESYTGATKQLRVSTSNPFNIFYRLDLTASPSGTVIPGYFAEQVVDRVNYLFISNNSAFTVGSTLIQSDTGITATILSANSSFIRIMRSNPSVPLELTLPLRDSSQDGTARVGTVSITAGSNTVTGVGTQFSNTANGYTADSYIRVGANTNSQIRRVTAITNSTSLNVSLPFTNTLISNTHFFVPLAAEPASISVARANGTVSNTNFNSLRLTISNSSIAGLNFITGEQVTQVDSANTYQGANAIVAFANSSTLFLSSVSGSWTAGLFALGSSSLQRYGIVSTDSNPNMTLSSPAGEFVSGFPVNFRTNSLSGVITGNATPLASITLPNDQTEYQIGPTVQIVGDGSGAQAIATVNTSVGSSREVVAIEVISPGSGYTQANVTIYANTSFGSNASARAIISPVGGHGKDAVYELGGRYVGISTTFDIGANEGYHFQTYGQFRRIGILENPEFADVRVTLQDFDRVNLTINNKLTSSANASITNWVPGEVVVQASSNAAGVVVTGNATFLQLEGVLGEFTGSNSQIRGYFSNTTANVASAEIIRFQVTSDSPAEIISLSTSGARAEVVSLISNTEVVLSNVVGKFVSGDTMVESSVNAYAIINTISTANGSRDVTATLGNMFDQTLRFTLTANTGAFANNENVIQTSSNAYGTVVSDKNEVDLLLMNVVGSFSIGQRVFDQTTNANGVIIGANSTYLKLTSVSQNASFSVGSTINNGLSSNATIDEVYPVLLLNNIDGPNRFQAGSNALNSVVGQTTGASGVCNSFPLILYPELVRDTGRVLYVDNFQPVTRTDRSKEEVRLVIKF
jgi:hypothetical protein